VRSVVAVLLAWLLSACGGQDPLRGEIRLLQRATTSAGASLTSSTPIERGPFTARATWDLRVRGDWATYRAALQQALPEYVPGAATEMDCSFSKRMPADAMDLRIEVVRDAPLCVRASFSAAAR
jgi:hypothetical protein